MNLTDAISDSLLENAYFGLPKDLTTFKALKSQVFDEVQGMKHLGVTVLKLGADGVANHHSFSIAEIMNVDWIVKESAGEVNNDKPAYAGIVVVSLDVLETATDLIEKKGYGRVDSFDTNIATNTARIFCRSHLFSKTESGNPTPEYTLTYEEDTGTLTADRI